MMFPSTACLIQSKIRATRAWGFDLSAACSAFTYSLTTASQLVSTGAHDTALVVGEDRDPLAGTPWHKHVPARVERVAAGVR